MTQEEAKTKVCPFISNCIATESLGLGAFETMCIADKCMAWEWKEEFDSKAFNQRSKSETDGYCKRLEK